MIEGFWEPFEIYFWHKLLLFDILAERRAVIH